MAWRGFAMGVCVLMLLTPAAPQDYDREAYARSYVQFLVQQIDQWTKTFPRDYNAALMRPPVDASKLSEAAKAGANELRDCVTRLAELSGAKDVLTNAEFRSEVEKAIAVSSQMNQAMGAQRFPAALYGDWDQVRVQLNNLARVYRVETLAVVDPPSGGGRGGRGGRGQQAATATAAAAPPSGGGVAGYIVDQQCAARGKGMWTNAACVARCIREGDKVVLVTEEGKVYQIANPDKIDTDSYGQKVTLLGKTNGDTITVDSLQM